MYAHIFPEVTADRTNKTYQQHQYKIALEIVQ
jgi:hypothetical protein